MQRSRAMGLEDYANSFWVVSGLGGSLWVWSVGQQYLWLTVEQIEKIKKRLIINKFKIKSSVPYDIMLSEVGAAPIEAIDMVRLIRYLKKIEPMKDDRWLKVVFNDIT